jgi:hypothetical protein
MQHEFRRIGDGRQAVLCETTRAVTPFGGLAVLLELLRKMGAVTAIRERLPFQYRSNNASKPEHILLAFWLAVAAGARRFSHLQMLRADRALQALCGVPSFPTDDTVRNFFRRFGAAQVATFFPALWRWFFDQQPARSCLLDLDSTVLQRFGRQEGAVHGYNPTRPKGRTHRPLLAFVSEPVLVLHAWLRSGNAADNRGAIEFLTEALQTLPSHWTIQGVRADGAFFDQKLLEFFEQRALLYTVVVRRHAAIQRQVHALEQWTSLDAKTAITEFTFQMPSWSRARRFIVVRLRLPDPQYQRLLEVPGYDFRVFVTNRTESPEWLWHHYDQRAAIEPRFSELKEDLGADDFCLHQFFPTEAAFLSVLFVFNLLSLLQSFAPARTSVQHRPATLRQQLFTCGAIAGRSGHKIVLFLSTAWGGLADRKPLLDKIAAAVFPTSPKLNATPATAPP